VTHATREAAMPPRTRRGGEGRLRRAQRKAGASGEDVLAGRYCSNCTSRSAVGSCCSSAHAHSIPVAQTVLLCTRFTIGWSNLTHRFRSRVQNCKITRVDPGKIAVHVVLIYSPRSTHFQKSDWMDSFSRSSVFIDQSQIECN
jgi:hypothetical protein